MDAYLVWFLLGAGLILLELAVPGFIIIFFGLGCWATALACVLFDIGTAAQLGVFSVATVLSLVALRRSLKRMLAGRFESSPPEYEALSDDIGNTAVVVEAICPPSAGRIRYRGSLWTARSAHTLPAGTQVRISSPDPRNKNAFVVAPLPASDIRHPENEETCP